VIGYVCLGRQLGGTAGDTGDGAVVANTGLADGSGAVAVTDHVDLTGASPLVGPNEEAVGPRFPVTAGCYYPPPAREAIAAGARAGNTGRYGEEGEVVLGTAAAGEPSLFERWLAGQNGLRVASEELTAVARLAAHAGLRLAAVVVLE